MEPAIGKPHLFLPTAKDVWEAVRDMYSDLENSLQIFDLKYCLNDSVKHRKREENDPAYVFLVRLNHNFDEARGWILGKKPLPSIREVFSEVKREEARQKVMLTDLEPKSNLEIESLALVSRGSDSYGDRRKKSWCDHYKKPWHTKETCWKIHGKP
ncbi:hypothetical protein POTOM_037360 [Populus tomentosa]|uniref:Uncharacterized protein n=1 Tax=Populus tomentosa TaxID=118781 RepID=A0A8X8CKF8_POPTO|nr:hypothetical protein POTOM_037360 [Populus tomentosa]